MQKTGMPPSFLDGAHAWHLRCRDVCYSWPLIRRVNRDCRLHVTYERVSISLAPASTEADCWEARYANPLVFRSFISSHDPVPRVSRVDWN